MAARNVDLAVKLRYDGKEVAGGISIARDDFRKLAVDAKAAGNAVAGGFTGAAQGVRSMATMLGQAQNALVGFFGVRGWAQASDAWANLKSRIDLVSASTLEARGALTQVAAIAGQTGQSLDAVGTIWQRMARNATQYNLSQAQIAETTRAVANAVTLSGTSAASAQAALMQFGQALASGQLRGEELNSVMEQTPALAEAIARGMGKTVGELRALGEAGQLTAEQVLGAIRDQSRRLADEAAGMALTIGRAMQQLDNAWQKWAGDGSAGGAAASVVKGIADNFNGLAAAASVAGGAFAAFKLADWAINATLAIGKMHPGVRAITIAGGLMVAAFEGLSAIRELIPKPAFEETEQRIGKLASDVDALVTQIAAVPVATAKARRQSIAGERDSLGQEIARREAELSAYGGIRNRGNSEYRRMEDEAEALNRRYQDLSFSMRALDEAMDKAGTKKSSEFLREYATEAGKAGLAAQDAAAKFKTAYDAADGNAAEQKRLVEGFNAWLVEADKKINKPVQKTKVDRDVIDATTKAYLGYGKAIEDLIEIEGKATVAAQDLTAAEAVRAKLVESSAWKKLDDQTKDVVDGYVATAMAAERAAAAEKARDQARAASIQAMRREAEALEDQVERARLENAEIGLTVEQLDALKLARLDAAIAAKEQALATLESGDAAAAEIKALLNQIDALRELRELSGSSSLKRSAVSAAKANEDEWKKFTDDIERGLTDSLYRAFESGGDFAKTFVDSLRNTLKTAALKVAVQTVVGVPVTGIAKSLFGGGGSTSGGGASDGTGLLSLGSNAYGAASGYSALLAGTEAYGTGFAAAAGGADLAGAIAAYEAAGYGAVATGLSAGATSAGALGASASTGATVGSVMSGLAAAAPYIAVAVALLSMVKWGGGTPHVGGTAYSSGTGYETPRGATAISDYYASQADANNMVLSDWTKRWSQTTADALGPAAEGFAKTINDIAAANGLTGGYTVGLGFSADGDDPVRARSSILDAAGKLLAYTKDNNALGDDPTKGLELMLTEQVPKLMLTALEGLDLNGLADSFLDSLNIDGLSAEAAQQAIGFVQATDEVVGAFGKLGIGANEVTAQLINALGGMEQAIAGLNAYYEGYFSAAERTAHLTDSLREQFDTLNLAMPATRAEFRSLVESIDLTSGSGAATYAALIGMAGAFGTVADAAVQSTASVVEAATEADNFTRYRLVGAESDVARAGNDIATAWQGIADSIVETARRLRGDLLTETQSFAKLQADFSIASAAARAGDKLAAGKLSDLASAVVDAAKLVSATGEDYNLIAARTIASLNTTASTLHDKYGVKIPGFAAGGWHEGGYAMVGEAGPELAYMPPARIYSNPDSRALLDLDPLVTEIRRLDSRLAAIERHSADTARATNGEGRAPILVETA